MVSQDALHFLLGAPVRHIRCPVRDTDGGGGSGLLQDSRMPVTGKVSRFHQHRGICCGEKLNSQRKRTRGKGATPR
jgi:hypothetical protein